MSFHIDYRPQTLDQVIGNESTIAALNAMLGKPVSKRPHVLLFTGPAGCGKTSLARIMAFELGCDAVDVVENDTADYRGIDTMREIKVDMQKAPMSGDARCWIFDEAGKMTPDAQSSLLKTLEDTPDHVYFILATTDPAKLLPTIRTRCMDFPVTALNGTQMRKVLDRPIKREKLAVDPEVLDAIIDNANGSPRMALVLLDKIAEVDDVDTQLKLLQAAVNEAAPAIELARALFPSGGAMDWKRIAKAIAACDEEPEKVRHCIRGYANVILLKGFNDRVFITANCFKQSMFYGNKSELTLACAEAFSLQR